MRKPFFASLFLLAVGATGASADGPRADTSTWRWTTTKAIEAQRGPEFSTLAAQNEFTQRYERYSFNGQIEGPR